jgi:hypothetical protein
MPTSLNPYIAKFDTDFIAEKSLQYRLTIQLALGGFSFALLDSNKNSIVGLECYQSDLWSGSDDLFLALERALDAKGLTNKTFHSVTCLINERICTLIPEDLYHTDNNEKLLNFCFNMQEGSTIGNDRLKRHRAVIVYAYPSSWLGRIKTKWPNAQIIHSSSVFLESLPKTDKPTVYVNVRNRDFDIAVAKDKLLFFNNFRFNTKDDFAYFLSFAIEQCGLSGEDTPIVLSGLIQPSSEVVDLCKRYVKDIHFVQKPHELQVRGAMEEVAFQHYFIHYQATR